MFGSQMITKPSVDLLRFFNAESTTKHEIKKWAKKQTLKSIEEFMSTFDSFEEFNQWVDRIDPETQDVLDKFLLNQDMLDQSI